MSLTDKLLDKLGEKFGDPVGNAFGRLCVFGVVVYTTFQHPPTNNKRSQEFTDALITNLKRFSAWCKKQGNEEPKPETPAPKPEPKKPRRFEILLPGSNEISIIQVKPNDSSDLEIYNGFSLMREFYRAKSGQEMVVTQLLDNGGRIQITPPIPTEMRN